MMPKGVEHNNADVQQMDFKVVKIPMMPKGVEHKKHAATILLLLLVKIPMMSKGVEHKRHSVHAPSEWPRLSPSKSPTSTSSNKM